MEKMLRLTKSQYGDWLMLIDQAGNVLPTTKISIESNPGEMTMIVVEIPICEVKVGDTISIA